MSSTTQKLMEKGLATGAPAFLKTNVHYETIMGSHAYGVADTSVKDKVPDYDVYGFAIPPRSMVFPHLDGHIKGFGPEPPNFEQWQNHHMMDEDALGGKGKEWDLQIFNIVKFFELCRENNPNMLDSLYTPENCVIHCTPIGRMVRDNRKLFLSKLAWKKFRGYAHGQLKKMNDKVVVADKTLQEIAEFEKDHAIDRKTNLKQIEEELKRRNLPERQIMSLQNLTDEELRRYHMLYKRGLSESQRFEIHKFHQYDTKFAYHILRLFDECEQILMLGDMDLQRAREPMKAIRRGEWTAEEVRSWAMEKEKALETAYVNCKLPEEPPIEPIKKLLLNCLEAHYGSLSACITEADWAPSALRQLDNILDKYRSQIYG